MSFRLTVPVIFVAEPCAFPILKMIEFNIKNINNLIEFNNVRI